MRDLALLRRAQPIVEHDRDVDEPGRDNAGIADRDRDGLICRGGRRGAYRGCASAGREGEGEGEEDGFSHGV